MKIYLASPLGFSESTRAFMDKIKEKLTKLGHEVLNPWKLVPPDILDEAMMINDFQKRKEEMRKIDMYIGKTNNKAIDSS